ncbi:MAG TPA: choice-of-anchor J domain-containing protein, partial [Candidatus Cloacimonadota bacterium]|nr:choice-of-anchor J domain-containing protein [Candidatus Cloacimonadota bacterium]
MADVYTIGDGTSTQNYVPANGFYDYSWSKTIYTAVEINTAGLTSAASLVGIGYYVGNTPANYTMLDQRVYIRPTTASIYETADNTLPDNTQFTQVYQGDYTFNGGGWTYIMFSTPFAWDGTSNLEILWENWDGDYLTGYPNFRYTTTTPEYRTVYKYADNDFPGTLTGTLYYNRPNIQFVTPQLDPPNPAVAIYPALNGYAFTDAVLSWQSGGGMPTGYNVYLDTVNPPVAMVSTAQPSTSYTPAALLPGTTYYWQIIPVNSNGPAADCPVWNFKTPGAEQLAESFNETTWPPPGWANLGTYTRSTTTPFHGAASAYKLAPVTPALLSTPMVSITTGSELNFWARTSATTGNGRIQIQYSPDRENWTDVGDPIALPTQTNWNNYVVDLSALAGNNYYLAFASSSITSTTATYIDHVFGPNITPLMPGPVSLTAPADAAINQSVFPTLTWTAGTTGGVATSYKVYLDTNPDPTTLIATVPTLNYSLETALAYLTTYYWKVVASNSAGDAEASAVRSFTTMDNPTISTFPWNVDFGTATADWPVLNWTQLSGLYPTPSGTTAQ